MTDKIYELVVEADTNDADYITQTTAVSAETIEKLKPIIEVIKSRGHAAHNWPNGDYAGEIRDEYTEEELSDEAIDFMSNFTPYGEHGIHTIESIVYYPIPEKVKLL